MKIKECNIGLCRDYPNARGLCKEHYGMIHYKIATGKLKEAFLIRNGILDKNTRPIKSKATNKLTRTNTMDTIHYKVTGDMVRRIALELYNPKNQVELADELGVVPSTIHVTKNNLEKAGWVFPDKPTNLRKQRGSYNKAKVVGVQNAPKKEVDWGKGKGIWNL